MQVVDALAAATDSDPVTMAPLYGAIDPEALDDLFRGDVRGHVRFEYEGHTVRVQSDETIAVDGTEYDGARGGQE